MGPLDCRGTEVGAPRGGDSEKDLWHPPMGLDHGLWNREGSCAKSLCSPHRGEPLFVADPCGLVGVPPDDWMRWMLGPLVQEAPVGLLLPTPPSFSLSPFPHPSGPSPFLLMFSPFLHLLSSYQDIL